MQSFQRSSSRGLAHYQALPPGRREPPERWAPLSTQEASETQESSNTVKHPKAKWKACPLYGEFMLKTFYHPFERTPQLTTVQTPCPTISMDKTQIISKPYTPLQETFTKPLPVLPKDLRLPRLRGELPELRPEGLRVAEHPPPPKTGATRSGSFPWFFVWFHYDFTQVTKGVSMVLPWFCRFDIVLPKFYHGFKMFPVGFSLGFKGFALLSLVLCPEGWLCRVV